MTVKEINPEEWEMKVNTCYELKLCSWTMRSKVAFEFLNRFSVDGQDAAQLYFWLYTYREKMVYLQEYIFEKWWLVSFFSQVCNVTASY